MKFALLFGFWGTRYTKLFLDYSIASLLFPKNLPNSCEEHEVLIRISTTASCRAQLKEDARFHQLESNYNVDVLTFPDTHVQRAKVGKENYSVWASLLNPLIHTHAANGYHLLFMHPDSFYPDGFLSTIFGLAQAGKKIVFTAGVRVDAEKLANTWASSEGTPEVQPISGVDFDKATLAHLHAFVERQFWPSQQFSHWPSAILFELSDKTVVGRFFDMHPIFVAHDYADHTIKHNLDVDYDYNTMVRIVKTEGWNAVGTALQPNGYFMSLTGHEDTWANRLYLVGDDPDADIANIGFPQSDSEKFLHIANWSQKYVSLKKIFCFQHTYQFGKTEHPPDIDYQVQYELNCLFESIINYPLVMQAEQPPAFSLELPQIKVHINV